MLSKVLAQIEEEYGTPDCVIYNAGITSSDSENLSASELIAHFKVDVSGAYTTVNTVVNEKFAAKKGAVIFTGGGLAMYPVDGFLPLSIDKAALRSLAYILHNRYEKDGVFVGTVTVCGTINGDDYFASDEQSAVGKFVVRCPCCLRLVLYCHCCIGCYCFVNTAEQRAYTSDFLLEPPLVVMVGWYYRWCFRHGICIFCREGLCRCPACYEYLWDADGESLHRQIRLARSQ